MGVGTWFPQGPFDGDEEGCGDGWAAQGAPEICSKPASGAWQAAGGSLSPVSLLCCSWGSARPLQRLHVREEGPPPCPGEDSAQPTRLYFPHDEEREAEGGPQGQEADSVEEGVWRFVWNWAWVNL